jgi:hypothetical protein
MADLIETDIPAIRNREELRNLAANVIECGIEIHRLLEEGPICCGGDSARLEVDAPTRNESVLEAQGPTYISRVSINIRFYNPPSLAGLEASCEGQESVEFVCISPHGCFRIDADCAR